METKREVEACLNKNNFTQAYSDLMGLVKDNLYSYNVLQTILLAVETNLLQNTPALSKSEKVKRKIQFAFYNRTFHVEFNSKQKYDVVFWPVQPKHLNFLFPVYFALLRLNITVAFVTANKDIAAILASKGIECVFPQEKISRNVSLAGQRRLKNLQFIIQKAGELDSKFPGIQSLIETSLDTYYFWDCYQELFEKLQNAFQPKYHLLGYDLSLVCRAVNVMANELKIATGAIQNGTLNYLVAPLELASEMFVWDELSYDFLKKSGYIGKVHLVGSPNMVGSSDDREQKRDIEIAECINGTYDYSMLICFSGPGHNTTENGHVGNIAAVVLLARQFTLTLFIIKLHPKDNRSYYSELFNDENVLIIDQSHELYRYPIRVFLNYCDILLTGASTVAIEALLLKKQAISLDVVNELGHMDILHNPMIYKCYSYESAKQAVESIQNKDAVYVQKLALIREFSEQYFECNKKKPEEVIASLIKKTLLKN
jgi:hypothetical protein